MKINNITYRLITIVNDNVNIIREAEKIIYLRNEMMILMQNNIKCFIEKKIDDDRWEKVYFNGKKYK